MKLDSLNVLALLAGYANAHGFLYAPEIIDFSKPIPPSNVRGIEKITYLVDSLRIPNTAGLCRGLMTTKAPVPMTLEPGKETGVTLAFNTKGEHVGKCKLEIFNQNMTSPVVIADGVECATLEHHGFNSTIECPGRVPANLVSDDMCLFQWKFIPKSIPKCESCVLRWSWTGTHMEPYEDYENCMDVKIVKSPPMNQKREDRALDSSARQLGSLSTLVIACLLFICLY